jgi:hypothetical protein
LPSTLGPVEVYLCQVKGGLKGWAMLLFWSMNHSRLRWALTLFSMMLLPTAKCTNFQANGEIIN